MSDQLLNITVSYAGNKKSVLLAVQPSLELSDTQVDYADTQLRQELVRAFTVIGEATFYLHEAESGRIMSKESFRDPSYCQHFPKYWYLVVAETERTNGGLAEDTGRSGLKQQQLQPLASPFASYLDADDELPLDRILQSNEHSDTKYRSFTFSCASDGAFGLVLRHFSLQPTNIPRSETPMSQRTHSRSDSFASADSLDTLKLATTFVSHVTPGGVAERAGLETGLVVHMINEESIIRSSNDDIEELLRQCGGELTLLALPKEHDDLQFLYPRYTGGEPGEYSTEDGQVSVHDFIIVKGAESKPLRNHIDKGQEVTLINGDIIPTSLSNQTPTLTATDDDKTNSSPPASYMPPTGLVPFVDDTSQDNSQSCDQPVHRPPDDVLIAGSLQEIENQGGGVGWSLPTADKSVYAGGDSLSNGGMGRLSFTPGLIGNDNKQPNNWYEENLDFSLAQEHPPKVDYHSSSSQPLESLGRTRSNSILRRHSARLKEKSLAGKKASAMSGSMSALDSISDDTRHISKSVDLGRMKLKKKGDKSLEALTRIQDSTTSGSQHHSIKRYKSDEHAHRVNLSNRSDGLSDDRDGSWMVRSLDSTVSPHRGSDSSGLSGGVPGLIGLSGQSYDEPRIMSGDSVGSAHHQVQSTTPSHTATARSGGRKAARGYQMQRARLHNSRSRISESDMSIDRRKRRGSETSETSETISGVDGRGRRGRRRPIPSSNSPTTVEEESIEVGMAKESPDPPQIVDTPTPPSGTIIKVPVRQFSLKEYHTSPPIKPRKPRPVSAVEPQGKLHHQSPSADHAHISSNGLLTSYESSPRQHHQTHSAELPTSKIIPLFQTRSASTPYGEQIVREVNIEEAIARSQMSQGVQMGYSITEREAERAKKSREVFKREKHKSSDSERGLGSVSSALRLSTELLTGVAGFPSSPTHQKKPDVLCHGLLSKKQDLTESGKRSQDRSWKQYYAVLSGTRIAFYKDKKDSYLNKPCDEPPIEVVPSVTEVDNTYNAKKKMKFVFRVATNQGSVFLLQATDAPSLSRWIDTIQQLNGGARNDNSLKVDSNRLTPGSPILTRRVSSPQPLNTTGSKTGKKKDDGGSKGLMGKLKRAFTRDTDEPDFSSFVTFGQALEDCPVSPDNKRVPLVVESCVEEVEKIGLEVEGLYRKGGIISKINSLSAEMDKGNYSLTDHGGDIHIVCSVLKKFFKELPDSVVPSAMYDEFVACGRDMDEEKRLNTLKDLVFRLPTAHYHTLRYLLRHLNRVTSLNDINKMTPRNIATVFGPTLMPNPYPSADGLHLDPNMNASYVIIELLCTQVEYLFDSELCAEEQRLQEEYTEALQMREEGAVMGSPSARHKEYYLEKEKALQKASPLSVRRIKNNLSSSADGTSKSRSFDSGKKRNSFIDILPPKHLNTPPLPQQQQPLMERGSYRPASTSDVPAPSAGGSSSGETKKRPQRQHVYEDVERVGHTSRMAPRHAYEDVDTHNVVATDSVSRTKNWVKQHNEMGWGEEPTGSMWSNKNRTTHSNTNGGREKRDKLPKKTSRALTSSLPPQDHLQDLISPYPPPPQMMYPANRRASGSGGNTLAVGGANRKVSYVNAVTDRPSLFPVKDSRSKDRADRFTSSEHYGSHYRYHGDESSNWKTESYSPHRTYTPPHHHNTPPHHHNTPPHHHNQQRRQYSSLQRPPAHYQHSSLSRRRSSDSPKESPESRQLSHSFSGGRVSSGGSLHRTYSSDSPPERGEGPIRGSPTATGIGSSSALKIESYL